MIGALIDGAKAAALEFQELDRFFAPDNANARKLVFYGEREIHYWYFQGYIDEILKRSDLEIAYITSDRKDPIFKHPDKRIKAFYFRHTLAAVFSKLDSKVLAMTNPGINRCPIKRAPAPVNHVYIFHGIASVHKGYMFGAFDYYDTVFCVAAYQVEELRKIEEIYGLPKKDLIVTGYPLAEKIYRDHQKLEKKPNAPAIILVAPTWGPSSIMESCIEPMIRAFADSKYQVWLRPHPEFMKRNPARMRHLQNMVAQTKNISFQLEMSSTQCLHEADILITEHSSISFEYAFGTERPVLFIDTPMRVDNPEWTKLGMEPVENTYRSKVGARLSPDDIDQLISTIDSLEMGMPEFKENLPKVRDEMVANWLHSSEIGADHIIKLCQ